MSGYNAELSTLADGFTLGNHINQGFTTSDEDNDNRKASNCATDFSGGNFHEVSSTYLLIKGFTNAQKKMIWFYDNVFIEKVGGMMIVEVQT